MITAGPIDADREEDDIAVTSAELAGQWFAEYLDASAVPVHPPELR